jgi:AcrR family transcriptional regulator
MSRREGPAARDRILEAAAAIVCEIGAARLTLDSVADRAGLSKGGVLYHFRSKDALLRGMIEGIIAASLDERAQLRPALEGRRNLECRLSLAVMLDQCLGQRQRVAGAILAASAEDPGLLDPVRQVIREDWARIRDTSADIDAAFVARLAVEGLFSLEMHGLSPVSPAERDRILAALDRLLDHGIAAPAAVEA